MDRYAEMQVFVRAAEDGSFTAAARNLALTPSGRRHLSNRIRVFLDFLQDSFAGPPPWQYWRGQSSPPTARFVR